MLHLLAIAREFGIDFTIDDFDRDRRADAGARRHEAVGPLPRDRRLPRRRASRSSRASWPSGGSSHVDAPTVDGRTFGDVATAVVETAGPGGRAADRRRRSRPSGSLRILRGNLAPDGCVVKLTVDRKQHRGPARVFDDEPAAFAAVKAGDQGRATSS